MVQWLPLVGKLSFSGPGLVIAHILLVDDFILGVDSQNLSFDGEC